MLLVLDSGPLGMLSNPRATEEVLKIRDWSQIRLMSGDQFIIPEITDYEIRRELLRANKKRGLTRLDELCRKFVYLELAKPMMREAAILWAKARIAGLPTAHEKALDVDVILAAQARNLQATYSKASVVVVTDDISHLSRYVEARHWTDI